MLYKGPEDKRRTPSRSEVIWASILYALVILLVFFACQLIVSMTDQIVELEIENSKLETALINCLNGGIVGRSGEETIFCTPAESFILIGASNERQLAQ